MERRHAHLSIGYQFIHSLISTSGPSTHKLQGSQALGEVALILATLLRLTTLFISVLIVSPSNQESPPTLARERTAKSIIVLILANCSQLTGDSGVT